jgi:aminoglycoside phosphotransferase (APT) family kinase protein
MTFRCSEDIIVKAIANQNDYTEYTTLLFLETKSGIPSPKPYGLVNVNNITLTFMSYLPSTTLNEVWTSLNSAQNTYISDRLDTILLELRSIPYSEGTPSGGVGGEGCKDIRRHLRHSSTLIMTRSQFDDFLSNRSTPGGDVFRERLRRLSPSTDDSGTSNLAPRVVFTHGNLAPDNIVVEATDSGYAITGLLDWEYSGFYPEWYESVRFTYYLSPYSNDDWFLYLPDCVSPKRYSHWWLLDSARERLEL